LQEQHRISSEFARLNLGVNVLSPICPAPSSFFERYITKRWESANHRPGYHIERYPRTWTTFQWHYHRYHYPEKLQKLREIGLQQFERMQEHGWVHGDLHGGNIVFDPATDRVRFIDFEFTCRECTPQQIQEINRLNGWNAKTTQELLALERQLAIQIFA
jgi:serine/threonine protein kinase